MMQATARLGWAAGKGLGAEAWEASLAEPRESWMFLCLRRSAPFAL